MAKASEGQKKQSAGQSQPRSSGGAMRPFRRETMPAPLRGFRTFREEMDQLFNRFLGGWNPDEVRERRWDFDVQQEDGTIKVRADAPGFESEDFDIRIRGDSLILCACHEAEKGGEGDEEHSWSRREFQRTIPLPAGVDVDHIDASYRQGVLTVELPINEEHQPKHIAVKG